MTGASLTERCVGWVVGKCGCVARVYPSPTRPASRHSLLAFVSARTCGPQARFLTPCEQGRGPGAWAKSGAKSGLSRLAWAPVHWG